MKGTLLVAPGVPEAAKEQVSLRSEDAALTVIQSCARRAGLGGGEGWSWLLHALALSFWASVSLFVKQARLMISEGLSDSVILRVCHLCHFNVW